jgi:hypothetical protein
MRRRQGDSGRSGKVALGPLKSWPGRTTAGQDLADASVKFANRAAADAFTASVLPVARQNEANGVKASRHRGSAEYQGSSDGARWRVARDHGAEPVRAASGLTVVRPTKDAPIAYSKSKAEDGVG